MCSTVPRYIANRFDPKEDITHGVETMNLCEISVDVANVGSDSWSLKTEKDAQTKMSGNVVFSGIIYTVVVLEGVRIHSNTQKHPGHP